MKIRYVTITYYTKKWALLILFAMLISYGVIFIDVASPKSAESSDTISVMDMRSSVITKDTPARLASKTKQKAILSLNVYNIQMPYSKAPDARRCVSDAPIPTMIYLYANSSRVICPPYAGSTLQLWMTTLANNETVVLGTIDLTEDLTN